jgi:hypothetical protein
LESEPLSSSPHIPLQNAPKEQEVELADVKTRDWLKDYSQADVLDVWHTVILGTPCTHNQIDFTAASRLPYAADF